MLEFLILSVVMGAFMLSEIKNGLRAGDRRSAAFNITAYAAAAGLSAYYCFRIYF